MQENTGGTQPSAPTLEEIERYENESSSTNHNETGLGEGTQRSYAHLSSVNQPLAPPEDEEQNELPENPDHVDDTQLERGYQHELPESSEKLTAAEVEELKKQLRKNKKIVGLAGFKAGEKKHGEILEKLKITFTFENTEALKKFKLALAQTNIAYITEESFTSATAGFKANKRLALLIKNKDDYKKVSNFLENCSKTHQEESEAYIPIARPAIEELLVKNKNAIGFQRILPWTCAVNNPQKDNKFKIDILFDEDHIDQGNQFLSQLQKKGLTHRYEAASDYSYKNVKTSVILKTAEDFYKFKDLLTNYQAKEKAAAVTASVEETEKYLQDYNRLFSFSSIVSTQHKMKGYQMTKGKVEIAFAGRETENLSVFIKALESEKVEYTFGPYSYLRENELHYKVKLIEKTHDDHLKIVRALNRATIDIAAKNQCHQIERHSAKIQRDEDYVPDPNFSVVRSVLSSFSSPLGSVQRMGTAIVSAWFQDNKRLDKKDTLALLKTLLKPENLQLIRAAAIRHKGKAEIQFGDQTIDIPTDMDLAGFKTIIKSLYPEAFDSFFGKSQTEALVAETFNIIHAEIMASTSHKTKFLTS